MPQSSAAFYLLFSHDSHSLREAESSGRRGKWLLVRKAGGGQLSWYEKASLYVTQSLQFQIYFCISLHELTPIHRKFHCLLSKT